jgi:SAM-dependent methyltransferase
MTEPKQTPEVLYPSGFYSFQTPILLEYVAAISGVDTGRALDRPFTYVDLGCGDGFTIVLLAAAYPESRFIGIDLNPEHVAAGRRLAAEGGLTNVEMIEASFADWRKLDLPGLDYVAMHGVWAWIPEEARQAVLDLVRDRVNPGGLLYVGYNAMPGWAAIGPLRQYVLEWTRGMGDDAIANVGAALKHLLELRDKGAEYFTRNPVAGWILGEMAQKPMGYVVHEIYASHWTPLPFSTVLGHMRSAGLDYVGSAELPRNFPRASIKAEFLPPLLKEKDPERAELYRDYVLNTFFRRDVFGKVLQGGERRPSLERFSQFPFGARIPVRELDRAIPIASGALPVEGEPFASIRSALSRGARRLGEIAQEPGLARFTQAQVAEALQALTIGFQVAPFAREATAPAGPPERWTVPLAINRRLLMDPVGSDPFVIAMSPTSGSAVPMSRGEAVVLLAVAEAGDKAAEWAWDYVRQRDAWLQRKGASVKDRTGHLAAFRDLRAAMGDRLMKWTELGIIAPT